MRLLNPILIKDVITGIKESTYEVQTESRLAYSGLTKEQNIAGVLKKYAWLYDLQSAARYKSRTAWRLILKTRSGCAASTTTYSKGISTGDRLS